MEEKKQNPNQPEAPAPEVIPEIPEDVLQEMPALDPGVLTDENNTFFSVPADLTCEESEAEIVPVGEEIPEIVEVTESVDVPEIGEVPESVDVPEIGAVPELVAIPADADIPEIVNVNAPEVVEVPAEPVLMAEPEIVDLSESPAPAPQVPEINEAPAVEEAPVRNVKSFFIPDEEFEEPAPVEPVPAEEFSFRQSENVFDSYVPQYDDVSPVDDALLTPAPETEAYEAAMDPAAGEAEASAPSPVRKGRPKRKKGDGLLGLPHLAATLIWLAIIVAIGVSLGKVIWVCAADVLAFGRENSIVTVTIVESDNIDTIATKLHDAGLVNYPQLFKLYAQLTDAEAEITTGTFQLNTNYDYHALVNGLSPSSSNRSVIEVLIPEGYNCRQIFQLLEENGVCSVASLEEYAANGEFADFWFLADVERGDKYCLEGYLFPDTYEFYVGSTPREALGKMLTGFDNRFTEELQAQLPALNERLSAMMRANGCSEEYIAAHQLTLRDVLIVASLIEEETASVTESPTIASVIYNRLTQDQEYERYLGIDAALIYATGDASSIDTSMDHPYNTYLNAGLTPGPITNPGLASIQAALNPADTGYYYYVLNPETGTHQFSKTLAEHEQWIEQFRSEDEE